MTPKRPPCNPNVSALALISRQAAKAFGQCAVARGRAGGDGVLQNGNVKTLRIEKTGRGRAFVPDRQNRVAAAGEEQNSAFGRR